MSISIRLSFLLRVDLLRAETYPFVSVLLASEDKKSQMLKKKRRESV